MVFNTTRSNSSAQVTVSLQWTNSSFPIVEQETEYGNIRHQPQFLEEHQKLWADRPLTGVERFWLNKTIQDDAGTASLNFHRMIYSSF
jgi:hypothetical protein